MYKYLVLLGGLLLLLRADNNAVDFLQGGLSARSLALGNTGAALGGHIDTVFLNPAALQEVEQEIFSAAVQNFDLVANKLFAWAGKIYTGRRPVVLGFVYADSAVDGLERAELNQDQRPVALGSFQAVKHNCTLALAGEFKPDGWWGISLRRYNYALADAAAEATGLDIGGRWHLLDVRGASVFGGISAHNLGRTKVQWSTGHWDTMPYSINSALAVRRDFWGSPLLFNLDCVWQENNILRFSSGLEYDLQALILRLGWDESFTYGLGLRYYGLNLDYAQTLHEDLGLQQRVSLLLYL